MSGHRGQAALNISTGLAVEHLHALVRSERQLEKALASIEGFPGVVFYTLVNPERRKIVGKALF